MALLHELMYKSKNFNKIDLKADFVNPQFSTSRNYSLELNLRLFSTKTGQSQPKKKKEKLDKIKTQLIKKSEKYKNMR